MKKLSNFDRMSRKTEYPKTEAYLLVPAEIAVRQKAAKI